ncbi:MAG: hypothetical protein WCP55_02205 [Lentisphaerota bacterium]
MSNPVHPVRVCQDAVEVMRFIGLQKGQDDQGELLQWLAQVKTLNGNTALERS